MDSEEKYLDDLLKSMGQQAESRPRENITQVIEEASDTHLENVSNLSENEILERLHKASDDTEKDAVVEYSEDEDAADLFSMIKKSDNHELVDDNQIIFSKEFDTLQNDTDEAYEEQAMLMGQMEMQELLADFAENQPSEKEVKRLEREKKKKEAKEQKQRKKEEKEKKKQEREQKKEQGKERKKEQKKNSEKNRKKHEEVVQSEETKAQDDSYSFFEQSMQEVLQDEPVDLFATLEGLDTEPLNIENGIALSEEAELLSIRDINDTAEEVSEDAFDSQTEKQPENVASTELEPKKKGFLAKITDFLFEEEADSEKEALPTGILSDENQNILAELDDEKPQKKKKKAKKVKEKKPKKEKAKKPKKEKKSKDKTNEQPLEPLPKRKVRVTFLFCLSLLVVFFVVCDVLPEKLVVVQGRKAYAEGHYEIVYQNLYGKKLSEQDQEIFSRAELILRLQRKLRSYKAFVSMDKQPEALDALLQGVSRYQMIQERAEELKVSVKVGKIYRRILNILHKEYDMTEEEAIAITLLDDNQAYSKAVNNVVNGLKYDAVSQTDYRDVLEPVEDEEIQEELELEEQVEPGNLLFEIFSR